MTTTIVPQVDKARRKGAPSPTSPVRRAMPSLLSLCASILLPSFLICGSAPQASAQSPPRSKADLAPEWPLGLNDVYLSKRPYTILVPKGTRHTGEFYLLVDGAPRLGFGVESGHHEAGKKTEVEKQILLPIGIDFFMSCNCSFVEGSRAKVREFAVNNDREYYCDHNVDGNWDLRILTADDRGHVKSKVQIWYRGEWRDTTQGDVPGAYYKKVQGGPAVLFDMKTGLWIPREKTGEKKSDDTGISSGVDKRTSQIRTHNVRPTEITVKGDHAQVHPQTMVDPTSEKLLAANDVYLSKRPYTILVPKGPQPKGQFLLIVDDTPPLVLSVKPSHDEAGKEIWEGKEARVSIGSDFSMSCKYAPAKGPTARVREFTVSNERDCFCDLNADGKWDLRILSQDDPKEARVQIWYQDEWRDATQGDRPGAYYKKLQGEPAVLFDMKTGLWVPRASTGQDGDGEGEGKTQRKKRG